MAYEVGIPYHLHMPSYFIGTFTEYPYKNLKKRKFFILRFSLLSFFNFFISQVLI